MNMYCVHVHAWVQTLTYIRMHVAICAQVVCGDQLTCKNIRGCKLWRAAEVQAIAGLTWAHETPGRL